LHHIDGDRTNNITENLATLCIYHHDLASMQIGLTKKLQATEIREYKKQWESKCASDVMALSRDRLRFYATVYKNPPRIRELFSKLSRNDRLRAVSLLSAEVTEDVELHKKDEGFKWQALPGDNNMTEALMFSLRAGELWPSVLPRVDGHPEDPDLPNDFSPPNGICAFHGFDLYCQLMTRTLSLHSSPIPLETLWTLNNEEAIGHHAGCLVSFRERAIGRNITVPGQWEKKRLGRVQFLVRRGKLIYKALMSIKTMYVFSDTAAESLRSSKVCGIGILEDAVQSDDCSKTELTLTIKPLIIGIGGFGQSRNGFWMTDQGHTGSHDSLRSGTSPSTLTCG
jgi:hypothetical protein